MNQIVEKTDKAAKVKEFNERIAALQVRTKNQNLLKALSESPRHTLDVVSALQRYTSVMFNVDEVAQLTNIIRNGGDDITQVDASVLERLDVAMEAEALLTLYADILNLATIEEASGRRWRNWALVSDLFDYVTV